MPSTATKTNLADFCLDAEVALTEKEAIEVMKAFSKLAKKLPANKLLKMAREINHPMKGGTVIKKMAAYI